MKRFLFLLMAAAMVAGLQAQNAACDGLRFKQAVFSTVKKTTVPYAPALTYEELPPVFGDTVLLQMDIYEPMNDNAAARPAVILAHGGSFIFGDKSNMKDDCERFAKAGYVAISIQYRLYPALVIGFPDSNAIFGAVSKAVGDMKAAVRFLREDAATANVWKVDTNHIFVGGYSAGAVAALHLAYMDMEDDLPPFVAAAIAANGGIEGNTGTASNQTYSSRVSGLYNRSGGIYRRSWIQDGDEPLVSIHGTADATVFYETGLAAGIAYLEGSGLVHPRAEEVGVFNYLETVVGGDHSSMYTSATHAAQYANFQNKTFEMFEGIVCQLSDASETPLSNASFRMAPNPAHQTLQITLPEGLTDADVEIWDMQGRLALFATHYQSGKVIPVQDLPNGLYAVRIRTAVGMATQALTIAR